MSDGVLIAREQDMLRTADEPLIDTLRTAKHQSKNLVYRISKRSFDIIFGFIGCLFVLPLAIFIKLIYVLTGDFGTIFYAQKRIGKGGEEFNLYKFRTMARDADEVLKDLIKKEPYKSEWRKYRKLKNDPRISKAGKILRKTSLDEFPQFFNVLKGDMSLIGPRPLIRGELDEYFGNHDLYESIRPGLTSWWAANGRSNTDFDSRLDLEYYYIRNRNLGLDLLCIARTAKGVLSHSGAD